jgi:hypothetical protein
LRAQGLELTVQGGGWGERGGHVPPRLKHQKLKYNTLAL